MKKTERKKHSWSRKPIWPLTQADKEEWEIRRTNQAQGNISIKFQGYLLSMKFEKKIVPATRTESTNSNLVVPDGCIKKKTWNMQ